ncbi:hypothetical protein LZ30DRAFT_739493 [Colletotrichum cereale]|nr:hypothetical protein LZ30DRAFT_739493 [Colletotrichum cereale]
MKSPQPDASKDYQPALPVPPVLALVTMTSPTAREKGTARASTVAAPTPGPDLQRTVSQLRTEITEQWAPPALASILPYLALSHLGNVLTPLAADPSDGAPTRTRPTSSLRQPCRLGSTFFTKRFVAHLAGKAGQTQSISDRASGCLTLDGRTPKTEEE